MGRTDNNGSRFKKKNFYSLQDGDMVFRILPPLAELKALTDLGELPESTSWSQRHTIHFGYKNSEGKIRPFLSPEVIVYETKEVLVSDPAKERLEDLKVKLEKAKAEGNAPLEAKLHALVGFKGVYSIDRNYHMNVVDLNGNIGTLKIRSNAKKALNAEIKRLETKHGKDKNGKEFDPLSVDNGRYFRFTRTGFGNDTDFKVSVYTETLDLEGAGKVEKEVVSKLTPDILNRIGTEASDLSKIATKLTSEEVGQIVSTSDLLTGKSPAVDQLIDARWKAERNETRNRTRTQTTSSRISNDDMVDPNDDVPNTPEPAKVVVVPRTAAPVVTPTVTPAKATVTPKTEVEEMSDDEFFKSIGA